MERLEGWLNVDVLPLPGVDLEMDVTREFPFEQVEAIYAEHFLEHLQVLQVLGFFESAHRALRPQGRLRLSTPNLDWVWQTHYSTEGSPAKKVSAAFSINRAFYGWQHRFLWNRELLELALRSAGFADLDWPSYGESRYDELRGIERHERYPDSKQHQHVLIVDAVKGEPDPGGLRELKGRFREELVTQIKGWQGVDPGTQKATPRADG